MKIQKNNFTKHTFLIASLAVLVFMLPIGLYGYNRWNQRSLPEESAPGLNEVNLNNPTDDQKQAGDSIKKDSVNNPKDGLTTDDEPSSDDSSAVSVTFTAVNQNGTLLSVRGLIDTVTNNGTCTLTFTKDTNVISKKSDIQALANSSTCKGFDIPTSELSSGKWHIQLEVNAGTKTGTASTSVTIQ